MRLAIIKNGVVLHLVEGELTEVTQIFQDCQVVDPGTAVVSEGSTWDGSVFTPPPTPPMDVDRIYAELWQAAHDYEYAQISGSAVGLIAVGVMLGKPKCAAVQEWIKTIWGLYYQRKATVTPFFKPSLDFSSCGNIPASVPELMAELYG